MREHAQDVAFENAHDGVGQHNFVARHRGPGVEANRVPAEAADGRLQRDVFAEEDVGPSRLVEKPGHGVAGDFGGVGHDFERRPALQNAVAFAEHHHDRRFAETEQVDAAADAIDGFAVADLDALAVDGRYVFRNLFVLRWIALKGGTAQRDY